MKTKENIERAFSMGQTVGEGVYGVAKLVVANNGRYYILKHFGKRVVELATELQKIRNLPYKEPRHITKYNQLYEKYIQEAFNARHNKEDEVRRHLEVYSALSKYARRQLDIICMPYKSAHPFISIQDAANQAGEEALTLAVFMRKIADGDLIRIKSDAESKREGVTRIRMSGTIVRSYGELDKQMSYSEVVKEVQKKLLDIFEAFIKSSVYHADFKRDNIIVVYKSSESGVINDFKLKMIDFGLSEVGRGRLITYTKNGLNFRTMANIHNKIKSRFSYDKNGILGDGYLYDFFALSNRGARPKSVRNFGKEYGMASALRDQLKKNITSAGQLLTRQGRRLTSTPRRSLSASNLQKLKIQSQQLPIGHPFRQSIASSITRRLVPQPPPTFTSVHSLSSKRNSSTNGSVRGDAKSKQNNAKNKKNLQLVASTPALAATPDYI